jgi:hypothetical protein
MHHVEIIIRKALISMVTQVVNCLALNRDWYINNLVVLTPAISHVGNSNTNFISAQLIYAQPEISDSPRGVLFPVGELLLWNMAVIYRMQCFILHKVKLQFLLSWTA